MGYSLNKVFLIGNLGRDPELKQVGSSSLLTFSVATSESWEKDGEWKEKTEWHRVNLWGPQAERLASKLCKGATVHVDGSIESRKYTGKDGVEKTSYEIKAWKVLPLAGYEKAERRGGSAYGGYDQGDDVKYRGAPPADSDSFEDSEIPF